MQTEPTLWDPTVKANEEQREIAWKRIADSFEIRTGGYQVRSWGSLGGSKDPLISKSSQISWQQFIPFFNCPLLSKVKQWLFVDSFQFVSLILLLLLRTFSFKKFFGGWYPDSRYREGANPSRTLSQHGRVPGRKRSGCWDLRALSTPLEYWLAMGLGTI